jgi:hypothetical protein
MKEKFDGLYAYMALSNEPKYMKTFGSVMKDMMCWMIENKQEAAENYIETLCSIRWRQYLTGAEAHEIASEMTPKAAWDYDTWLSAMKQLGLEYERETIFNSYALWIAMNAMHSDNGAVIAALMGKEGPNANDADYIKAVYHMAMNLLLDEDGKYCIRRYFLSE